jgi:hypothetical protein
MKLSFFFGGLILVWILVSYLILGISAVITILTFGYVSTSLSGVSLYAEFTIRYLYEVLLFVVMLFLVGIISNKKVNEGVVVGFLTLIALVYIWQTLF